MRIKLAVVCMSLAMAFLPQLSLGDAPYENTESRSPCLNHNPLKMPLFGDTHIHTRYSLDASTQDTRTTPKQAYDFARGKTLGVQPWDEAGKPLRNLKLNRPLDFAVVTDHAELFGETAICNSPDMEGYSAWQCKLYRKYPRAAFFMFNFKAGSRSGRLGFCGDDGSLCRDAASGPWQAMQNAAEEAYDRSENCEFTSFVGYEWTGLGAGDMANLHRNVIFRNASVPEQPLSFVDYPSAETLWSGLDKECLERQDGCDALIIPHNSNLSAGKMFSVADLDGNLVEPEILRKRQQYEPIVEVMQHKGSSECFFDAGQTEDELCAFEQLPYSRFAGKFFSLLQRPPKPTDGFLRDVLNDGLVVEQDAGINPFQFGFIASTDTHIGAAGGVAEDDYLGHGGAGAPASEATMRGLPDDIEYNPGGLAVVWAEENSRDAIFSAMRRRETYGTSGPRMVVRFFAAENLDQNLCDSANYVAEAYENGVPMGSVLPPLSDDIEPAFLVSAAMDSGTPVSQGTPLQQIQIIKGWIDQDGNKHQKVHVVAGSPNNGASVDLKSCKREGDGYKQLCEVWKDPEFDSSQRAYYYARVVENPSCRWSQYICVANRVDCSSNSVPAGLEACCADTHRPVIQERAWTSPIWYSPEGGN